MIAEKFKQRIVEAIREEAARWPSSTKHARALGISPAQLSRIKRGDIDKVLSDSKWIHIARRLGVDPEGGPEWKVARTPTFEYISNQLAFCQDYSVSAVLVDIPDIGKTYTAKYYVRTHPNAVYIDCSLTKSKQQLIRRIAREFGIEHTGRYADVFENLVWYLKSLDDPKPLIVLDEAGDLNEAAFLELKALWNATEGYAGFYMMGADGLAAKIERGKERKKVGYAEIFSRYGDGFKRITPLEKNELKKFKIKQMKIVAKANGLDLPAPELYARTGGGLRRVFIEYKKQQRKKPEPKEVVIEKV